MLLDWGGRALALKCDVQKRSCLYYAAQSGHVPVVKMLLGDWGEGGGEELMMLKNAKGSSCLAVAALHGHWDVVMAFSACLPSRPAPHMFRSVSCVCTLCDFLLSRSLPSLASFFLSTLSLCSLSVFYLCPPPALPPPPSPSPALTMSCAHACTHA